MEWCLKNDVGFLMEHPNGSSAWGMREIRDILKNASVDLVELYQCMYGLKGPDENNPGYYKKPASVMTKHGGEGDQVHE